MRISRGFSVIELLVVITIIGLLSAAALAGMNLVREKARDARRIQDVTSIQKALDLYMISYNVFPVSVSEIVLTGDDNVSTALINDGALPTIPLDPLHPTYAYSYQSNSQGNNYTISFCLETDSLIGYAQGCENTISP